MEKVLDLNQTVYALVHEYPEVIEILKELGFENITNPVMMNTAGRVMTLPKGAVMKGVPLEEMNAAFKRKGFQIVNQKEESS